MYFLSLSIWSHCLAQTDEPGRGFHSHSAALSPALVVRWATLRSRSAWVKMLKLIVPAEVVKLPFSVACARERRMEPRATLPAVRSWK